jgi:hypothetical protein
VSELLVSPSARVSVRQRIAPVGGMRLDRLGQAPIDGAREIRIQSACIGRQIATVDVVKDDFAPAQFFDLDDEEKLTRASFDLLPSGVSFTATDSIVFDRPGPTAVVISYATYVVDAPGTAARPVRLGSTLAPTGGDALSGADLDRLAYAGAAARAVTRSTGLGRFDAPGLDIAVGPESYLVVAAATLRPAGPQPGKDEWWSYTEAAEQRRRWIAAHPGEPALIVVPAPAATAAPARTVLESKVPA